MSGWPYWLRAVVLLGVPLAVIWAGMMAFIFNCTDTGRRWSEMKRRENDLELWNAQRMSIIAAKAPSLHAEIVRSHERQESGRNLDSPRGSSRIVE